LIRVAHRTRPLKGETANGDAVFVRVDPDYRSAAVAVIDGLGHGPHAAVAADAARGHLEAEDFSRPAAEILRRLHDTLRGTRGAAATICVLTEDELSVCGVGNVGLRSHGTSVPFLLSPGILGSRVHRFRDISTRLRAGDRVVLYSDGIGSTFSLETIQHLDAEAACESLFASHGKATDDATVLVMDVGR
jgi:phosphoserine phosphatase RsbX